MEGFLAGVSMEKPASSTTTTTNKIMSNRPKKAKIDVTKIVKEYLFKANSGAVYLDVVMWPSDGKYGDDHMIVQEIPREKREAGEKGAILGNATLNDEEQAPKQEQTSNADTGEDADDIPF